MGGQGLGPPGSHPKQGWGQVRAVTAPSEGKSLIGKGFKEGRQSSPKGRVTFIQGQAELRT